jgi:hypothetical protein
MYTPLILAAPNPACLTLPCSAPPLAGVPSGRFHAHILNLHHALPCSAGLSLLLTRVLPLWQVSLPIYFTCTPSLSVLSTPSPAHLTLPCPLRHPVQVSLASDFMYNTNSRESTATFGYDYILRQCRLRGRIDTGGRRWL